MTNITLQDAPTTERKSRKSVAFSEGTTVMDENGEISQAVAGEDKTTAMKHTNGELQDRFLDLPYFTTDSIF
jgi:hypothetical protein